MRLLVVEDDKTLREGIGEYLAEFGYTVIESKRRQRSHIKI